MTVTVGNGSWQKIEDLLRETAKIVGSLQSGDPKKLEQARDFCLALSNAALAYHESIFESRPPHPYRD